MALFNELYEILVSNDNDDIYFFDTRTHEIKSFPSVFENSINEKNNLTQMEMDYLKCLNNENNVYVKFKPYTLHDQVELIVNYANEKNAKMLSYLNQYNSDDEIFSNAYKYLNSNNLFEDYNLYFQEKINETIISILAYNKEDGEVFKRICKKVLGLNEILDWKKIRNRFVILSDKKDYILRFEYDKEIDMKSIYLIKDLENVSRYIMFEQYEKLNLSQEMAFSLQNEISITFFKNDYENPFFKQQLEYYGFYNLKEIPIFKSSLNLFSLDELTVYEFPFVEYMLDFALNFAKQLSNIKLDKNHNATIIKIQNKDNFLSYYDSDVDFNDINLGIKKHSLNKLFILPLKGEFKIECLYLNEYDNYYRVLYMSKKESKVLFDNYYYVNTKDVFNLMANDFCKYVRKNGIHNNIIIDDYVSFMFINNLFNNKVNVKKEELSKEFMKTMYSNEEKNDISCNDKFDA